MSKITGIIFAGGKSSRMGQNKALVKYKRQRLIDRTIQLIKSSCDYLLISSNVPLKDVPYALVPDLIPNIGPLGGLYSVLTKTTTSGNIVLACDVPNIEPEFFDTLLSKSKGYDAVIPRLPNGKLEPLVAFYSKSIIPVIEEQIKNEDFKLVNLIFKLNVHYVDVRDEKMFKNVNAPTDL